MNTDEPTAPPEDDDPRVPVLMATLPSVAIKALHYRRQGIIGCFGTTGV